MKRRQAASAMAKGLAVSLAVVAPPVIGHITSVDDDAGTAYAATAHQLWVTEAMQPATDRIYFEPWSTANYIPGGGDDPDLVSACAVEYSGYGGWFHCDDGSDAVGNLLYGFDLHDSPDSSTGYSNAYLRVQQSDPYEAVWGYARQHVSASGSTGRNIELDKQNGSFLFQSNFVHLEPSSMAPVGTEFTVLSGVTSFLVGQARHDDDGACACIPPHVHWDGTGMYRSTTLTNVCRLAALAPCYDVNPWSGSPPTYWAFHITWSSGK